MFKKIHQDNKGFTIIEVLIVLAIAALIMLIVFLAVPALQRNGRNTETRNEASRLLTTANEFVTNANGALPTTAAHATQIRTAASMTRITNVTVQATATSTTTTVAAGSAIIVAPGVCSGSEAVVGTGRQIAVVFGLEPTNTEACISM